MLFNILSPLLPSHCDFSFVFGRISFLVGAVLYCQCIVVQQLWFWCFHERRWARVFLFYRLVPRLTRIFPLFLPEVWVVNPRCSNICLVKVKSLSRVWLFVIPWTVAYQAPLSMGFSRHEYWIGLPFPSPGDLLDPRIELGSLKLHADSLSSVSQGKFEEKNKLYIKEGSFCINYFSIIN